ADHLQVVDPPLPVFLGLDPHPRELARVALAEADRTAAFVVHQAQEICVGIAQPRHASDLIRSRHQAFSPTRPVAEVPVARTCTILALIVWPATALTEVVVPSESTRLTVPAPPTITPTRSTKALSEGVTAARPLATKSERKVIRRSPDLA